MLSPLTVLRKGIRAWKRVVYPWYVRYPAFWPRPEPRFRLYCVGLGKTGTHSIANVFRNCCRADHEVGSEMDIRMVRAMLRDEKPPFDPVDYVRRRDRHLRLEVDSNNLNRYFLVPLLSEFPEARFVLTIRDCFSWMDSVINHQLGRRVSRGWRSIRRLTFNPQGLPHEPADRPLRDRGLPPLAAYFQAWEEGNRKTIETVPADRLLVVRTDRLGESLDRIAEFAGVPPEKLDRRRSHSYRTQRKFHVLNELDPDYLRETADRICGDLMREYFRGPARPGSRARFPSSSSSPRSRP